MTYSMSLATWDGIHSRMYRRDCSGFVDMAWHLSADPDTGGLNTSTYTTPISIGELLPGDLLDDVVNNESGYPYHAILFGGWEDLQKTHFWYYSFGGTPLAKVTGASFSDAYLSGHPTSDYRTLRYKNVAEAVSGEGRTQFGDLNNDGFDDLISIRNNGDVVVYWNIGSGYDGSNKLVASGFTDPARTKFGDLNNDGFDDLISIRSNGDVVVYWNIGSGYDGSNKLVASGFVDP